MADATDPAADDIVFGQSFSGLPSVGLVTKPLSSHSIEICTGALIAPNYVMTAAHCVGGANGPEDFASSVYTFKIQDPAKGNTALQSDHVFITPQWAASGDEQHDIAIIHLAQSSSYPTFPLMPVVSVAGLGSSVFLVGYGATESAGPGGKHAVAGAVDGLSPTKLLYGSNTGTVCGGDSGGPVLHSLGNGLYDIAAVVDQTIVGCRGKANGARVDVNLAWILSVTQNTARVTTAPTSRPPPGAPTGTNASNTIAYSANSQYVVDVNEIGRTNSMRIQLSPYNEGVNQQWNLSQGELGSLGKCVQATSEQTGNRAGSAVELWDCNLSANQKWILRNNALELGETGLCLDLPNNNMVPDAPLWVWPCNSTPAQTWNYHGTVTTSIFASAGNESFCMDARYAGTADGTPVQIWNCNNTQAQSWTLGAGMLKALDRCAVATDEAVGAKIELTSCQNTRGQSWELDAGQVKLAGTNLCLDIPYGTMENGNQLQLFTCKASSNQMWTIE